MPLSCGSARKKWLKPYRPPVVEIHHFNISIGVSATTGTATLPTPVDPARSVILFGGFFSAFTTNNADRNWTRVDLTDATTVTATRATSATHTITARGCVIHFAPWVVTRVQQGTVTIASGSTGGTATITGVDTARSVPFYLGVSTANAGTTPGNVATGIELTNSTTVTATRGAAASGANTVGYCVLEFAPGVTRKVQPVLVTSTSSSTTDTATLTAAVDVNNSVIVYQGAQSNQTSENALYAAAELTDPTTVTFTRVGTTTTSRSYYVTVVEFAPGLIRQKQAGTTAIASGGSTATTTVASTVLRLTALFWAGNAPAVITDADVYVATRMTSATGVQATRAGTGTNSPTAGWQLVEWA